MTKLPTRTALLVLILVAVGCARSSEPGRSASPAVPATSSTLAPTGSSLDAAVSGWPEFTSVPGGYRLRHPPGWRAKESFGSGGPVLSLLPPKGGGISVLVTGSRCLDTVSMVVTSTLRPGNGGMS